MPGLACVSLMGCLGLTHFPSERRGHPLPFLQMAPAEVAMSGQGDNTQGSGNPKSFPTLWEGGN